MKPFQILPCLIIALLILSGCNEDVYAPVAESPYPVVHCVLNKADTAHYLRLTKSFSGPVDAYAMAQNPDSLYFRHARVVAEWCGGPTEMELTHEIRRDTGIFFSQYSVLFKTTERLERGVVMHIYLPEINTEVFGSTTLMEPPVFLKPNPLLKKDLNFYDDEYVLIQWEGLKGVCETTFRFKYLEVTESGMDTCHLDWIRNSADFAILPQDLLDYFNHWIKDKRQVNYRKILGIDILVSTGNGQLADYLKFKDWSIDYIDKPYSNLINAYGIMACRADNALIDYQFNQRFIDTLVNSRLTEHLKFVRW
ncbi:MAG: hypothetical protein WC699_07455 [Bacteroidales bacterium]